MRLVLDENVERPLVERLRQDGHDVVAVSEIAARADDSEILALALAQGALVVTADKDFGQLIFQEGARAIGVLLLRLPALDGAAKADLVARVIAIHGASLFGQLTVLDGAGLRQKRLPRH